MKTLTRVVWSEGMYLGPHHFQAQNRYFEDSIRHSIEQLWYEPWGLLSCRLDDAAIRNGRVSLLSAHGIFEDGLVFDMPATDELPSDRNIADVFSPLNETLLLHLAVPARRQGHPVCDLDGQLPDARFHSVSRTIVDSLNGVDEKQVDLAAKNIRIITADEITNDLLTIPIARLRRDGAGYPVYDPGFIPPCTRITASEYLMSLLGRLLEMLEEKQRSVARPRSPHGTFQAATSQLDVANFWFLHTINSSLAPLRHLFTSKRGHPEELFYELSRLAGSLCTFGIDSRGDCLPAYDHRQLDVCFQQLDDHIRRHLEILVPTNVISIPLRHTSANFYIGETADARCFGRSTWILSLRSSCGEAAVISRVPSLVKVCSAAFVSKLVERAMPGLLLSHLQVPPSALAPKVEFQYFSLSKDLNHPCWKNISDSHQVGIYIPDELPESEVELQVILET